MASRRKLIRTLGSLGLLAAGLLLGFFITVQVTGKKTRVLNPLSSYAALRDTRESLALENKTLSQEIETLADEIDSSEGKLKETEYANKVRVEALDRLKERIGLTALSGEGVNIVLADSNENQITPNSIAHAADMRDLVNLLWSSGASAISINGQRLVATTSIDCIVNTVMINSVRTVPPFEIRALGDRRKLAEKALDDKLLPEIHARIKEEGLVYEVSEEKSLMLPAYNGGFIVEFSKNAAD